MTLPPLLLRLSVHTREHAWPTLWLPSFLVWPLLSPSSADAARF
jgi:hypothetical protein